MRGERGKCLGQSGNVPHGSWSGAEAHFFSDPVVTADGNGLGDKAGNQRRVDEDSRPLRQQDVPMSVLESNITQLEWRICICLMVMVISKVGSITALNSQASERKHLVNPILVKLEGDNSVTIGVGVGIHHGLDPGDRAVFVAGGSSAPHLGVGLDCSPRYILGERDQRVCPFDGGQRFFHKTKTAETSAVLTGWNIPHHSCQHPG